MYPHEWISGLVREESGRRENCVAEILGHQQWSTLAVGLVDQLSVYCDSVLGVAHIRADEPRIFTGVRDHLMLRLRDRGRPLRLREATERYDPTVTNWLPDFVDIANSRRWRFLSSQRRDCVRPWVRGVADTLGRYRLQHPRRRVEIGLVRLLEDVTATYWCATLQPREAPKSTSAFETDFRI